MYKIQITPSHEYSVKNGDSELTCKMLIRVQAYYMQ